MLCGPKTASLLMALLMASTAGWGHTGAAALRESFAAVRDDPALDIFGRPLYLQSVESSNSVQGDIHAVLDFPYEEVRQVLVRPDAWCHILILHLNVHYCRPEGAPPVQMLTVGVGRKVDQPLGDLHWVDFSHRVGKSSDDYLAVELQAPTGPLGTTNYRIVIEATPLAERRTLLHLRYAYGYGLTARLATQAYLATLGSGKVGFSPIGRRADGQPQRVGGVRGALERNTLRYYMAIESYLGSRAQPAGRQLGKSLEDWFAATERYPQLHEVEREAYVAMKLREVARQEREAAPSRNR